MADDYYKVIVQEISIYGYAYNKLIKNHQGQIVDVEIIDVNHVYAEIVGIKREHFLNQKVSALLKNYAFLGEWLFVARLYAKIEKMLLQGETEEFFCNNNQKWYLVSAQMHQDEKFFLRFMDQTAKKEAEHAMQEEIAKERRKNEEEMQLYIQNAPMAIFVVNINGDYLKVNEEAVNITGYEEDELLKMNIRDLLGSKKNQKKGLLYFQKILAGEKIKAVIPHHHKNGQLIYLEILANKVKNEQVLGFAQDVTQKVFLEQRLRETEKKYQILFDSMALPAFVAEVESGLLVEANESAVLLSGYQKKELLCMNQKELHPVQDKDYTKKEFERVKNEDYSSKKHTLKHKNGQHIPVEINLSKPFLLNGKKCVIGIFKDITEESLKEIELKLAKEIAEDASKAKSEFLANMSHEIRTPLNGVIGFTELLQKEELNQIQKEYAKNIELSAKTLLNLINDILDFSKIEAGKIELQKECTDIIELVNTVIRLLKYEARKKRLDLKWVYKENVPRYMYIDSLRIKQILLNLVGNALKFTEKGSIEILLEFVLCKECQAENKGCFVFTVSDSGVGISKEQKDNIFKAFTQADPSIVRKYGGTGLGLTISNMLLEKMDSCLELESTVGKGSKFYFHLVTEYQFSLPSNEQFTKEANLNKKELVRNSTDEKVNDFKQSAFKIMIVEDVEMNVNVLKAMLRTIVPKSQIKVAENGQEAVSLFEKEAFDLIFMDVQLPIMDGYTATTKMRICEEKLARKNKTVIIALTAGTLTHAKKYCLDCGMDDYLAKPIDLTDLKAALNKYLEKINNAFDEDGLDKQKASANFFINTEHFDKQAILDRLSGDYELLKEVEAIFLREVPLDFNIMKETILKKDLPALTQIAHKIRSRALTMGCIVLAEWAGKLEVLAVFEEQFINDVFLKIQEEFYFLQDEMIKDEK